MKLLTKRIIRIFTIIAFVFSLCGCSNNSSNNKTETETIAGKYLPYSADFGDITMSYDDMVEADMVDDIYVTIDKNQKTGEADFGEGASSFTLEDGNMVFEEDDETAKMGYEILDNGSLKIRLTDMVEEDYGADIHIYFAKEGDAYEAAKKASQEAGGTFSNILDGDDDDELLAWWNGEWYGWWLITSASGEIAEMEGEWYDTCAIIDIGDDYTGTILIWDEDGSMDDPIGEVEVTLSADGLGSHGTLYSESGYFMDHELEHADWMIDPAVDYSASWLMDENSSSTDGIENYIRMDGSAESDSDDYSYVIHLRKWGTYWDDIIEDERPYYYETWYVPLIEEGKTMPYQINNEDTYITAEPEDSSVNSSTEAGIVTLAHLKEVYAEYSKIVNNNYVFSTKSYEDVVSDMGVEGRPQDESVSSFWTWSETKRYYEWLTEDGESWIIASFSKNSNGVFMCYSFSPTNDIIE